MKLQLVLSLTLLPLIGLVFVLLSPISTAKARAIGLDEAARIALRLVPGEVEAIDLDRYRGKEVYEVEIRGTDHREHEVIVDAHSGEILHESIDD